jgi:hypothetical protein
VGRVFPEIDAALRDFLARQHVFFVATAPAHGGHVNVSPRGLDSFRVTGPRSVAWLDLVGSGAETIAHVRENRRITLLFCAFEGAPRILRLYGEGTIVEPADAAWAALRSEFPPGPARAIVRIEVTRIADSCGFGVPLFRYGGERPQLPAWMGKKDEEALLDYQRRKNATSLDGLPALRWVAMPGIADMPGKEEP